jgi:hypothetical protein
LGGPRSYGRTRSATGVGAARWLDTECGTDLVGSQFVALMVPVVLAVPLTIAPVPPGRAQSPSHDRARTAGPAHGPGPAPIPRRAHRPGHDRAPCRRSHSSSRSCSCPDSWPHSQPQSRSRHRPSAGRAHKPVPPPLPPVTLTTRPPHRPPVVGEGVYAARAVGFACRAARSGSSCHLSPWVHTPPFGVLTCGNPELSDLGHNLFLCLSRQGGSGG